MRLHLTLLFLLFIVACAPTAVEPVEEATEADVEAINSLHDEFIALDNAGDAAGLASLYTNDAVLMPPNQAAVTGNQAIESWFQTTFDGQAVYRLCVASHACSGGGHPLQVVSSLHQTSPKEVIQ